MDFWSYFPSFDSVVLFLFAHTFILHLIFIKKERLVIDIVSVYVSFFLTIVAPLLYAPAAEWLALHPLARISLFVGLVVVLHILFHHSNISTFSRRVKPLKLSTSLIYRVSVIGLLFTGVLYFAPDSIQSQLGSFTTFLFAQFFALLFWFFFPLVLAFAYRFKAENGWLE